MKNRVSRQSEKWSILKPIQSIILHKVRGHCCLKRHCCHGNLRFNKPVNADAQQQMKSCSVGPNVDAQRASVFKPLKETSWLEAACQDPLGHDKHRGADGPRSVKQSESDSEDALYHRVRHKGLNFFT